MLFASSEAASALPPNLLPAMIGTGIFVAFGALMLILLLPAAVRLVDKATPGDLSTQLVPLAGHGQPNVALAIVVGCMMLGTILGMAVIIAAAIH